MITTPIFTRILSTTEYGEFNVYSSWLGIISVLVTLNLFAGVYTKGLVKNEEDKLRFSSSMLGLCTTCILLGVCIYLTFRETLNELFELSTIQMILMFVSIWSSSAFYFWSASQRVDFKYKALVFIICINSLIKPICSILFVMNAEDKVTARIFSIVLVDLISFGGLYFIQMFRGKAFYVQEYWKHAVRFNVPLIPHYLSMTVLANSDRIMIKNMVGADSAGIYSLAYSISQIMAIFNSALFSTVEPWLYKKLKNNQTEDIGKLSYITLTLIAIVNLILIALAPEVVAIFSPPEYKEAIWIIPPVAMSVYFTFAYTFFAVIEFHFEKNHYISYATMSGAIINIILNYVCINIFGYMAASYTTLLCYMIYAIAHYLFSQKLCDEKLKGIRIYNLKKLIIITVLFMVSGFFLMMTYYIFIIRYSIIAISIIVLYVNRRYVFDTLKNILALKRS